MTMFAPGFPLRLFAIVWALAIIALVASTWIYHRFLGGFSIGLNISYVTWVMTRIYLKLRREKQQQKAEFDRIDAEYKALIAKIIGD